MRENGARSADSRGGVAIQILENDERGRLSWRPLFLWRMRHNTVRAHLIGTEAFALHKRKRLGSPALSGASDPATTSTFAGFANYRGPLVKDVIRKNVKFQLYVKLGDGNRKRWKSYQKPQPNSKTSFFRSW
jgi:hypothetical protein